MVIQPLLECFFHWGPHYFVNDWTCCQKATFSSQPLNSSAEFHEWLDFTAAERSFCLHSLPFRV